MKRNKSVLDSIRKASQPIGKTQIRTVLRHHELPQFFSVRELAANEDVSSRPTNVCQRGVTKNSESRLHSSLSGSSCVFATLVQLAPTLPASVPCSPTWIPIPTSRRRRSVLVR